MAKKPILESHTQRTKHGTGDFYGTGYKNPVGRIRSWSMGEVSNPPKNTSARPKKLA